MTSAQAQAANEERKSRRRLDEARCAWEFRIHGDLRGAHSDTCVRPAGILCSREYDPGPPPEDENLYEGSALLSLWEDTPHSWQLAGWNVRRRNA